MADYIEFGTSDEGHILVELAGPGIASDGDVVKAGLRQTASGLVERVPAQFESTLEHILRVNAAALVQAVQGLANPPAEVQLAFGLKVTGEVGYFVVGKTGGEINYNVTLTWRLATEGASNGGP
jgi:hypothetical protein